MKKNLFILLLLLIFSFKSQANHSPQFSTAGFYSLENSNREVFNMNVAWKFHKGTISDAYKPDFDDNTWETVSVPHGLELLPTEASGCINYQGEAWYRKQFKPDPSWKGKKIFLHFEAIMGKSQIYINGELLKKQYGGYLPCIIDLSEALKFGQDNVIAVCTDNTNDTSYPPGKVQEALDFSYFGGIYRDCWLIVHNKVFITDPNYENHTANGGLFVSYDKISEKHATVNLKLETKNENKSLFKGKVIFILTDKNGINVDSITENLKISPQKYSTIKGQFTLKNPLLWSPENPNLYYLTVKILTPDDQTVDGYKQRIGIRSVEFKGNNGFWLNGKPYPKPLIGANRHQDFAIVGNALSNNIHWRDTKKLRDAGLKVIRNAHYPQDPAFMDACDELGLFVIINTPGWQFWNEEPIFEERVYSDIRNMIRRDRNHVSLFFWEPILNETWYPDYFAKNVIDIVNEEYPYPYCYNGCDATAKGQEHFSIIYTHPSNGEGGTYSGISKSKKNINYFTREWGDNVDDWYSHNSPSRTNRVWGEQPMLIQAQHYANPPYKYTSYDALFRTSKEHFGGCLWHSFDHQRGYHPDPFYGGLMDVFRQPKYSYYLFQSQRDPKEEHPLVQSEAMIFIAHEMTPFSGKDVQVYSNCDEVKLTVFKNGKQYIYKRPSYKGGIPYPIITFKDAYNFMDDKALARQGKQEDVFMLAEGYINGKLAATYKVAPSRRPDKLILTLDDCGTALKADGSDFIVAIASLVDKYGNVKRLNNYRIRFTIEGEGKIMGDESIGVNPTPIQWGTAPILIQSTPKAGRIKLNASVWYPGSQMPLSGELEFESIPSSHKLLYSEKDLVQAEKKRTILPNNIDNEKDLEIQRLKKELNEIRLKEVEKQQEDFGEK